MVAVFKGAVQFDGGTTRTAGDIVTADIADASITPAKKATAAIAPAANAACAILNTTTQIELTVTSAANTAISTTSSVADQEIYLRAMAVSGGGSYTLAVTGGTLTLNSTGEAATVIRTSANDAWRVKSLTASSSTGANIATIV